MCIIEIWQIHRLRDRSAWILFPFLSFPSVSPLFNLLIYIFLSLAFAFSPFFYSSTLKYFILYFHLPGEKKESILYSSPSPSLFSVFLWISRFSQPPLPRHIAYIFLFFYLNVHDNNTIFGSPTQRERGWVIVFSYDSRSSAIPTLYKKWMLSTFNWCQCTHGVTLS